MGVAASAGILAYMVLAQAPPELTLSLLTIPAGSMLPDIDHDRSKLGRNRKKVSDGIKFITGAVVIGFVAFSYMSGGPSNAILNAGYVGFMALLINIIENNKHVKKQLGFITKHRGIMHTLIPPIFLIGTIMWTSNLYYQYLIFGLSIGYVVHLLGDMATEMGAPILWPLTKANVRYFRFNTNRHGRSIELVCNAWCIIFVLAGIYFGVRGGL